MTRPCKRCRLAIIPATKESRLCYFCERTLVLEAARKLFADPERNVTHNILNGVTGDSA